MSVRSGYSIVLLVLFVLTVTVQCRFETLDHLRPQANDKTQRRAVVDLLKRLLGDRHREFIVSVNRTLSNDSLEVCELRAGKNDKIVATGSTGVAVASGIYNYLKYFCNCHVSWSGDQLDVPRPLPKITGVLRISTQHKFRYYQNVCTVSYSFVWWDWPRWQREIDWMALNGINLPLAFTGQEALWQEVYRAIGLNQSEIEEFFSGPAFLAWNRMGNMFDYGGPLTQSWHVKQLYLQFKILERMRSFGMIPVLPAFSGNIPKGILRLYPKANVTRLGPWARFNCSYSCAYILDPRDPLFLQIGSLYLSQVVKQFGTDHIYNTDTFNEMIPPSSDTAYLSAVSRSVFAAMTAVDPQAVWLMQGWLFFSAASFWKPAQIKALLQGVPIGRMIVLDLFAETEPIYSYTESFYGQPFIWCMLHNFGGNIGLYGTVESVNSGPFKALDFPNSTMVGIGLTPEGIEQNPVVYELMTELAWRKEPVNLAKWASLYAFRRYGSTHENLAAAWRLLFASVYNCTVPHYKNHNHSPLVRRPSFRLNTRVWYDPAELFKAWKLLMDEAPSLMSKETFRYDLVDVTRQVLQDLTTVFYMDISEAFYSQKLPELLTAGGVLVYDLLPELDRLLSSDRNFLLGVWIERARSLGLDEKEAWLYEMNARNQITLWGPDGEILDYASKEWGGLMGDYYAQRWGMFVETLVECLDMGNSFNQDAFNQAVFQIEKGFVYNGRKYPTKPVGDTYEIAHRIFLKYYPQAVKSSHRLARQTIAPTFSDCYRESVFLPVDPQAVWLMQGWLFFSAASFWKPAQIKALLQGVPIGRMLVLDLFAETKPIYSYTESFYGQPFIWCMLHNFGGNSGLYGAVESINSGPFLARDFPNSTMVGIGLTPEGIEQNPVVYELMTELAWRKEPVNLTKWASLYAFRRYGSTHENLAAAWRLLFFSVYNSTVPHYNNDSPLVHRPAFGLNTGVWYNPAELFKAWKLLMDEAPSLMSKETFRYDLVDVTRQVMQDLTTVFYLDITEAFHSKKLPDLLTAGGVLLYDLLPELDQLLSSDRNFLLGVWIERARSLGLNEKEAWLYEIDARNQITLWGPDGQILDYASKEWGGLMEDYYAQRWGMFVETLVECLDRGESFNQDAFNKAVFHVEKGFVYNGRKYPTKPVGDTYEIAHRIFLKYYPQAVKSSHRLARQTIATTDCYRESVFLPGKC